MSRNLAYSLLGFSAIGALVGGWATPSYAISITDGMAPFTIGWNLAIAGQPLTATANFSNVHINTTQDTLQFDIGVTNTTGTADFSSARFTSFGWNTNPDVQAVAPEASSVYDIQVNGAISGVSLDICFKAAGQNNCNGGGGGGLEINDPINTFQVTLTFSHSPGIPPLDFTDFRGKFQTSEGSVEGSGSLVPVPAPIVGAGLPGLVIACGGLLGLARRRRSKQIA